MSKKAFKTIKKLDPLQGGDVLLDKVGLPSLMGSEYGLLAGQEAVTGSTVTAPASTPTAVDTDVQAARDAARKRQAAASGLSSTVLTSSSGLSGGGTGLKTLLGS